MSGFLNAREDFGMHPSLDPVEQRARFEKALNVSSAAGKWLYVPTGYYGIDNTDGPVVWTTDSPKLMGGSATGTVLQFSNLNEDCLYVQSAQNPLGSWDASAGEISNIQFRGNNYGMVNNGKGVLVLNALHQMTVRNVRITGADIAFDMRNNCYLSSFYDCATEMTNCGVGILLRGANPALGGGIAGSGSDITMTNCRFGGKWAAVWMEQDAGGYHFNSCQFGGGTTTLGTPQDIYGSLYGGRSYMAQTTVATAASAGATTIQIVDGSLLWGNGVITIGSNPAVGYSRSGNTLTLGGGLTNDVGVGDPVWQSGGVTSVSCNECSWEGSGKRWLVRSNFSVDSWRFINCAMQGITGNDPIGIMKNGSPKVRATFVGTRVVGAFDGPVPLALAMNADSNVTELNTEGGYVNFNGVALNLDNWSMCALSGVSPAFATNAYRFSFNNVHYGTEGNRLVAEDPTTGDGRPSWSSYFYTLRSTASQSISNATATKVTFDASGPGHGTSWWTTPVIDLTNDRWTCPVSGYDWRIVGSVGYDASAVTGTWQSSVRHYQAGGTLIAEYPLASLRCDGTDLMLKGEKMLTMDAGEYVELWTTQSSGGARNVRGDSGFAHRTYLQVSL